MKIRYCSQRGEYDCGAIAILNALKWAGARVSVRGHASMLVEMTVSPGLGSSIYSINKSLIRVRRSFFTFVKKDKPTLSEVEKRLNRGEALLLIHPNEIGLHASLILPMEKNAYLFLGINAISGKTVAKIPRRLLKRWLRGQSSVGWFIKRIKESRS